MRFWQDYAEGAQPYFTVAAHSLPDWPFNDPGYTVFPVLNLAVAGSGGGIPDRAAIRHRCWSTGYASGDRAGNLSIFGSLKRRDDQDLGMVRGVNPDR